MNIFRFIADFLHLISFFILILKIKNTKNCLGTQNFSLFSLKNSRSILQNPGDLFGSFLVPIYRFVLVLGLFIQLSNEDLLHRFDNIYHLPHEIQKTLLSCNIIIKIGGY